MEGKEFNYFTLEIDVIRNSSLKYLCLDEWFLRVWVSK